MRLGVFILGSVLLTGCGLTAADWAQIQQGMNSAQAMTAQQYQQTSAFTQQMIANSGQTIADMQNRPAVQGTWAQPRNQQIARIQPINEYGALIQYDGKSDYVSFAGQKCKLNSNLIQCGKETYRVVNGNTISGDGVVCKNFGGAWSCYSTM